MVTTDEKTPSETVTADAAPALSEPNTETSATREGKLKENGPPEAVDKVKEEPTPKRVQEGRAYNNRDRRYNNDRYTKDRNNKDHKKHDYQKNIKSDFSSQKETDDPVQIRKQVKFLSSRSNFHMAVTGELRLISSQ